MDFFGRDAAIQAFFPGMPAHTDDFIKPTYTSWDQALVKAVPVSDIQAMNGNRDVTWPQEFEKNAQDRKEAIAKVDSADSLTPGPVYCFEQSIRHEPEQMPSRFAENNLPHALLLAEMLDQVVTVRFEAADLWWVVPADKKDLGLQRLVPFASLETHLAYLLGHQPHHKHDNRGGEKQGTHVREATRDHIRIEIVEKSRDKKESTHREKDP